MRQCIQMEVVTQPGGIPLAVPVSQDEQDERLLKALESAVGAKTVAGRLDDRDPKIAAALVRLVEDRYQEAHPLMWEYRGKWALNEEFFLDRQQSSWNPEKHCVERNIPAQPGMPKSPKTQFNIFKPIIVTAVARFLSTHPQILVKSDSTDKEAVDAARVCQRIVGQHDWQAQDMESILAEALPCLLLHGSVILKVEWDPHHEYRGKRPKLLFDASGQPVRAMDTRVDDLTGAFIQEPALEDDQLTPRWEVERDPVTGTQLEEDWWEGSVRTSVVPAPEFLIDPNAPRWQDRDWCMHVSARSVQSIYKTWNVHVPPDTASVDTVYYNSSAWTLRNWQRTARANVALVKELWIEPGTYAWGSEPGEELTFPNGYVIVTAGGKLLSHGPNPYRHRQPPFIFIPCLRAPRDVWGDTWVHSLRVSQASVNKTAAQIQQANDLCANPQWLLPMDTKMPRVDMVATAGVHKRYEPQPHRMKPEMIPGQSVAVAVFRYLDWVLTITQMIAGQHEGGLAGGVPANVEAGVALEAIAERDTSRLAVTATEIGRAIARWAWMVLRLRAQFKTAEENISVVGRFMETEVLHFGDWALLDKMQASVVPESVTPSSRAARFQKAVTLFNLRDESGRPGISMREFKRRIGEDTPEFMTREAIETGNARHENYQFLTMAACETQDMHMLVEDHGLHAEEHQIALVSPEFRANLQAWQACMEHLQKHVRLGAQEMSQAAAAMGPQAPVTQGQPQPSGAAPEGVPSEPGEPTLSVRTETARPMTG